MAAAVPAYGSPQAVSLASQQDTWPLRWEDEPRCAAGSAHHAGSGSCFFSTAPLGRVAPSLGLAQGGGHAKWVVLSTPSSELGQPQTRMMCLSWVTLLDAFSGNPTLGWPMGVCPPLSTPRKEEPLHTLPRLCVFPEWASTLPCLATFLTDFKGRLSYSRAVYFGAGS